MELQYETDHKAGLQYATKVFYRNMGICKRKPVSVGRGDRTLCSKFIFYDSLFESCEQPASKHHIGDGHRSNGQGCRGKCPVSQYLKYNDNHIFYLISDGERSLYDRCPRFKSKGYGYWLSIVLSAIWLALYTGSDRLQLFDVMDSIQPVHKAISAYDISTLCDVCTCRRSGDRA